MDTPRSNAAAFHATWPIGFQRADSGRVVDLKVAQQLETELAAARAALSDIHTTAHCLAKAGPLHTPDLKTAWSHFLHLSAKATLALAAQAETEVKRLTEKETID